MHLISPQSHSRRAFLRRAGQLAFTGAALPTALNLAAMSEAAAFTAGNDYKALVCVFLYGGNDYANTLIPYDLPSYGKYQTIRGTTGSVLQNGIALGRDPVTNAGVTTPGISSTLLSGNPVSAIGETGLQYALHHSMGGMRDLYNAGQMAVLLNCGPLVRPQSRADYRINRDNSNFVPPKLFSHNDQQSVWQSTAAEGATTGWGGHIGDLAMNSNIGVKSTNSLFTCISVTSNAVFLSGQDALSYQVGSGGAVRIRALTDTTYGFANFKDTMRQLATDTARTHMMESEYNRVTARAFSAETDITGAISGTAATNNVYPAPFNAFPDNLLASQLRMVARLIKAQSALGTKRQVFMVSLGGFDLHDGLVADHTRNMGRVSGAIKSFYDCLSDTSFNMANQVTTFTASEFGRTLSSNGDGSDHGWGGHQFVVGGAVKGGYYGYAPPVSVGTGSAAEDQWSVGQGRLLPTTSVDQIGATLATWFGAEPSDLPRIMPNLSNFGGSLNTPTGSINYPQNLGFML